VTSQASLSLNAETFFFSEHCCITGLSYRAPIGSLSTAANKNIQNVHEIIHLKIFILLIEAGVSCSLFKDSVNISLSI